MDSCHNCGAALLAEAAWCGQCYAVRPPASAAHPAPATQPASATHPVAAAQPASPAQPVGGVSLMSPTRTADAQHALAPALVKTRWRKTATTFGPLGRILATIGLVVPFILFVVVGILTGGFTIAGAVIWGFVVMPWGLRDTWKAGQLPAR